MHAFITGASGFLGRHLVARCRKRGWTVTALVRREAARSTLPPDVRCVVCDLADTILPPETLTGVDVVIHAAAAVRDWAPWRYFHLNNVRATENLCAAMVAAGCRRLIHISTVAVYGAPRPHEIIKEDAPPRRIHHWNYYRRSKLLAEQSVWDAQRAGQLSVTVIRPAMVYGAGDRTFLGRIIPLLQANKMVMLGNPDTPLPLVHVNDVVAATLLAAVSDKAHGEAFNIVNDETVTQRQFFDAVSDHLRRTRVRTTIPYSLAYTGGWIGELAGHLFRFKNAPPLTRYPVFLFGYPRHYSIAKAKTLLDWEPTITFTSALPEVVNWFRDNQPALQSS